MPTGKKSSARKPKTDCADCSSSGLVMAPNDNKSAAGKEPCSWFEIHYLVKEVARQAGAKKYDCILGIANGGIIPAKLLAEELGIDDIRLIPVRKKQVIISEMPALDKKKKYLIVDDIYDTGDICGKVAKAMKGYNYDFAFCMTRHDQNVGMAGRILNHDRWMVFPWEQEIR
jgi:hypoxanthine phosphoribosyltransferase